MSSRVAGRPIRLASGPHPTASRQEPMVSMWAMTQDSAHGFGTGGKTGVVYRTIEAPRAPPGRWEEGAPAGSLRWGASGASPPPWTSIPCIRVKPWSPLLPTGRNEVMAHRATFMMTLREHILSVMARPVPATKEYKRSPTASRASWRRRPETMGTQAGRQHTLRREVSDLRPPASRLQPPAFRAWHADFRCQQIRASPRGAARPGSARSSRRPVRSRP